MRLKSPRRRVMAKLRSDATMHRVRTGLTMNGMYEELFNGKRPLGFDGRRHLEPRVPGAP
jgi:hypothetical protein